MSSLFIGPIRAIRNETNCLKWYRNVFFFVLEHNGLMVLFLIKSSYIFIRQTDQSKVLDLIVPQKTSQTCPILKWIQFYKNAFFFCLRPPVMPSIHYLIDGTHTTLLTYITQLYFNQTGSPRIQFFFVDTFITWYLYWTCLSMCFCNLERAHKSPPKTMNKIVFFPSQTPRHYCNNGLILKMNYDF